MEKIDLTWESVMNYLEYIKGQVIFDDLNDYPLLKKGLGSTKLIRVYILCYVQISPQIVRGPVWMEERLRSATSSLC